MSAVNVFTDAERAIVLTDGATYEPDGTLVLIRRKCFVMEALKAVVAGRGPFWFHEALARTLPNYASTIEDLEAEGRRQIERCIEAAQERGLLDDDPALDVFLVGWSRDMGEPMCLQYTTRAPEGVKPFSIVESVLAPSLPGDAEAAVLRSVGPMDRPDYDRLGIAIMEEQRRQQGILFAPGQFLVGGHILRTDITARGITQRMLHTWKDDKVNGKIRPTPRFDPVQAPNVTALSTTGLNRKKRRQIAQAGRRGAA